jgi:drug/metabolite transporter (DMT)-like permease
MTQAAASKRGTTAQGPRSLGCTVHGEVPLTSRPVLLAFAAFVLLAGANAAAVKSLLGEMPPFWSAGLRFVIAGGLLFALMVIQRRSAPRGNSLLGTVLFGVFGFCLAYFFLYQAIGDAGSGTTMTVLAIVPLLTVLLSVVHGIERPRLLGVVGSLIAAGGIIIVAADQLSLNVPLIAIALLLAGATCQAESVVIVKRLPPGDPVAANAIGMLLGGTLLVAVSLVAREPLTLPTQSDTLVGMAYLIGPGSIGVFMLALYVLAHWTASATSYAFLLFPLVAIVLGAVLFAEPVQPSFLLGGAVVVVGVYVGAIYRPKAGAKEPEPGKASAEA